MRESRTPIGPIERAVLEYLEAYVDARPDEESLTRESAVDHLVENDFERVDARQWIDQLLSKGYLYEVRDDLRIPPWP